MRAGLELVLGHRLQERRVHPLLGGDRFGVEVDNGPVGAVAERFREGGVLGGDKELAAGEHAGRPRPNRWASRSAARRHRPGGSSRDPAPPAKARRTDWANSCEHINRRPAAMWNVPTLGENRPRCQQRIGEFRCFRDPDTHSSDPPSGLLVASGLIPVETAFIRRLDLIARRPGRSPRRMPPPRDRLSCERVPRRHNRSGWG